MEKSVHPDASFIMCVHSKFILYPSSLHWWTFKLVRVRLSELQINFQPKTAQTKGIFGEG